MDISQSQPVNVLVVGAEGTGKHTISAGLTFLRKAVNIKVITTSRLPLPDDCECNMDDVQFICFMMSTASKDSMKVLTDCLGKVDVSFFLGRSAIVANTKDHTMEDGKVCCELNKLSVRYDTQLLYVDTENETEKIELCRKLMRKIECAIGLRTNVIPCLFDCIQMTGLIQPTQTQISAPATPIQNDNGMYVNSSTFNM